MKNIYYYMTTNELRDLIKECIVEAANTSELEKLGFQPIKESHSVDPEEVLGEILELTKSGDDPLLVIVKIATLAERYFDKVGYKVNENDTDGLSEMKLVSEVKVSKELEYHLVKKLPLTENVFRTYSDAYFALINEVRELYHQNKIELCDPDAELVESDLGKKAIYEGREVYLDAPIEVEEDLMMEVKHRGKNVHLNRPFRTPGGPKKYAVYVKSKGGNIKKVTFGDPGLRVRGSSAARRKSFAARHKCSQKKDRTTAGYWSCRSHRIKSLGNKGKGRYW